MHSPTSAAVRDINVAHVSVTDTGRTPHAPLSGSASAMVGLPHRECIVVYRTRCDASLRLFAIETRTHRTSERAGCEGAVRRADVRRWPVGALWADARRRPRPGSVHRRPLGLGSDMGRVGGYISKRRTAWSSLFVNKHVPSGDLRRPTVA